MYYLLQQDLKNEYLCVTFSSGCVWEIQPLWSLQWHHRTEGEATEGDRGAAGNRRCFPLPHISPGGTQAPPPALQAVWLCIHRLVPDVRMCLKVLAVLSDYTVKVAADNILSPSHYIQQTKNPFIEIRWTQNDVYSTFLAWKILSTFWAWKILLHYKFNVIVSWWSLENYKFCHSNFISLFCYWKL